jgi:hypothetical protein
MEKPMVRGSNLMRTDHRGFKIKTGFGLKSDFILLFPRHPRSIAFALFGCLRVTLLESST